jgi:hypothetical protein
LGPAALHFPLQRCDEEGRVTEASFSKIMLAELELFVDYKVRA